MSLLTVQTTSFIAIKLGRTKSSVDKISSKRNISSKCFNGIAYRLIKDHVNGAEYSRNGNAKIVSWLEFERKLETENEVIISCVRSLAKFQRWLNDNAS